MKRHKSHFPLAIYEATFEDGSKARLSFGRRRKDGSPDADFGRAMVELLYCTKRKPITMGGYYLADYCLIGDEHRGRTYRASYHYEQGCSYIYPPGHVVRPPIVDGVIEFKGERTRDPHFSGVVATETVRRISAKQALRDLLAALSNPALSPDDLRPVYEQARRIAA
jgi:hypothetical protein